MLARERKGPRWTDHRHGTEPWQARRAALVCEEKDEEATEKEIEREHSPRKKKNEEEEEEEEERERDAVKATCLGQMSCKELGIVLVCRCAGPQPARVSSGRNWPGRSLLFYVASLSTWTA